MVENNSTVLTRSKSKHSDHEKVKKLRKAITRRFNSKSYETISLSNKDDVKKNVITFIHSNGLIQSDVNAKNKKHRVNTNNNMDKSDKKRDLIYNNKENLRARRFSLPSPEILKELQNHKSKLSSSPLTIDSLKSFSLSLKDGGHSHSAKKTSNPPSPKPTTITATKPIVKSTTKTVVKDSTTPPPASNSTKTRQNNSVKFNSSKPALTIKTKKSPRPKSKLSESMTLPTPPSSPVLNKPSAPSLNEMYLEEVKDHQKFLQYKNLINSEQGRLSSESEVHTSPLSAPPPPIPSSMIVQSSSNVIIQNPFKPPFTTLSPSMTTATTMTTSTLPARSSSVNSFATTNATDSPFDETLSHLPKPSSLSFYTQPPSNFDSVPPKINGSRNGRDYSVEKVTPKIDLISRRDSLDFYFDKLSQPSKFSYSSNNSSSHLNFPGPTYTSLEPDIPSLEVSKHRMMAEPQPTYNVAHSNFNQVMKDTFSIRNKLEDKVEETKFQMMIAITQLNLINEQLDILNCNNLK